MNKTSHCFWNNDQGAPIGAISLLLSPVHARNLLGTWARGSSPGYGRCIARDVQDKQSTGSAWPWHRICRATLTRQTKHEAASDSKWGVVRCCLPCGCSCVFASVTASTWWLWLNNTLSGDAENSRLHSLLMRAPKSWAWILCFALESC